MTTTSQLDRTTVGNGALAEYEAFADLVAALDDAQWHAPTRCDGFEVRDVAGHVIGLAEDVAKGVPGSRTAEEEAATVRDDTPAQAGDRLRAAVGSLPRPPRGARRRRVERTEPDPRAEPGRRRAHALVRHLRPRRRRPRRDRRTVRPRCRTRREHRLPRRRAHDAGWGPATLALDDVPAHTVGGGGPTVAGDPLEFVLVATGRRDPGALGLDATVNIYAA